VNFCFKRDLEQVRYNVGFCPRCFGQISKTDIWNKNWNLPRFLTPISRKIICDIWNVGEKTSGTKSSFLSISLHAAGFPKSMSLGIWDMKIRYWTENDTLECVVRGFLLFPLFLSVLNDPSSGLPRSALSYGYLEFGDVTWDFLMRTCLFCSPRSSSRARTFSLSSFYPPLFLFLLRICSVGVGHAEGTTGLIPRLCRTLFVRANPLPDARQNIIEYPPTQFRIRLKTLSKPNQHISEWRQHIPVSDSKPYRIQANIFPSAHQHIRICKLRHSRIVANTVPNARQHISFTQAIVLVSGTGTRSGLSLASRTRWEFLGPEEIPSERRAMKSWILERLTQSRFRQYGAANTLTSLRLKTCHWKHSPAIRISPTSTPRRFSFRIFVRCLTGENRPCDVPNTWTWLFTPIHRKPLCRNCIGDTTLFFLQKNQQFSKTGFHAHQMVSVVTWVRDEFGIVMSIAMIMRFWSRHYDVKECRHCSIWRKLTRDIRTDEQLIMMW
jgi:hypothetical protein